MADHDELISQFIGLTEASASVAENYLGAAEWNLEAAVSEFFTSQEEEEEQPPASAEAHIPAVPGGGRTLGDDNTPSINVPAAATGSTAAASAAPKKKFGSLKDLASSGPSRGAADSDDEDDTDYDPDLYAGGEKSGLAVQNPDDLKRKILEKAKKQQGRARDEAPAPQQSHFSGRAQTLGGDEEPSRVVQDPSPAAAQPPPRAERTLHFWANGFSVDDGPLYRNDDPQNAERLEMIRRGRAPYDILNVGYDQEADVKLEQHEGPYVQPKRKFKPFSGQGQRLGSPTPGSAAIETPQPAAAPETAPAPAPTMEVDQSQPILRIQIRLGDGSRLASQFNADHTVGDLYSFVDRASTTSQARPYTLMTTFPNKDLTDKSRRLEEDFKRGGVVVQRWT